MPYKITITVISCQGCGKTIGLGEEWTCTRCGKKVCMKCAVKSVPYGAVCKECFPTLNTFQQQLMRSEDAKIEGMKKKGIMQFIWAFILLIPMGILMGSSVLLGAFGAAMFIGPAIAVVLLIAFFCLLCNSVKTLQKWRGMRPGQVVQPIPSSSQEMPAQPIPTSGSYIKGSSQQGSVPISSGGSLVGSSIRPAGSIGPPQAGVPIAQPVQKPGGFHSEGKWFNGKIRISGQSFGFESKNKNLTMDVSQIEIAVPGDKANLFSVKTKSGDVLNFRVDKAAKFVEHINAFLQA